MSDSIFSLKLKKVFLILGVIFLFLTLTTSVFLLNTPNVFGFNGAADTAPSESGSFNDGSSNSFGGNDGQGDTRENDGQGDTGQDYESGGYDYGDEGSYDFGEWYSGNYDDPGTYDDPRTKSGVDNIKDLLSGEISFGDGAKIVGANILDAAASFFGVNFVSELFTGKTIGEHLGVKTVVSDVYDAFKGALQGFGIDVT